MSEVAVINPPRASLIGSMAARYGMEPKAFADTVRATCMPSNTSNEEFAAFLLVAKEYGLNPVTKEVYAFPKKGGGIQPIVGIDGWMNLINSHPQCDGIEFDDEFSDKRELLAITCRIFRKDRTRPVSVTEYMDECKRPTEPWQKWPKRMLRHKAAIQAARYAFGFAGIIDPDEAERSPEVITTTQRIAPPPPPVAKQVTIASAQEIDEAEFVNAEDVFKDAEARLSVVADLETWEEVWSEFQHYQEALMPPDWDHLVSIGQRERERVDP